MSFSGDVKEELSRQFSSARHCQLAELAAIISMCGDVVISETDRYSIKIHTENAAVARKCFTLLKKGFKIESEIVIRRNQYLKKSNVYLITVFSHEDSIRLLKAMRFLKADQTVDEEIALVSHLVVQRSCCKRAFVRGAFLASGSISAPEKFYHLEIVCNSEKKAVQLQEIMVSLGIDAKIVGRKKHFVVYIKEGAQIVDFLALTEANVSLMNLENIRILKEMRNNVNRKVNCEAANINKTVSAAVKQIEDIRYIQEQIGLDHLPEGLEEIAALRLEYPEATLKELGMMLTPSVGKSGVNHRLRKISDIACKLKENKEELYYD
ncbi:MAG: DNA-binding protein WhiA [Ruminococcus sp.]|jgi:DNA-binding protein WhiA